MADMSGRDAAVVLADPGAALASTADGGVTWTRLLTNPQGYSGQLDVWPGTVEWLLVPGAGLWGTSPGASWHEIS